MCQKEAQARETQNKLSRTSENKDKTDRYEGSCSHFRVNQFMMNIVLNAFHSLLWRLQMPQALLSYSSVRHSIPLSLFISYFVTNAFFPLTPLSFLHQLNVPSTSMFQCSTDSDPIILLPTLSYLSAKNRIITTVVAGERRWRLSIDRAWLAVSAINYNVRMCLKSPYGSRQNGASFVARVPPRFSVVQVAILEPAAPQSDQR